MAQNNPKFLIIHHTGGSDANPLQDSSNFTFAQCNEQHRLAFNFRSSLGFYCGYHYYIDKEGVVTRARLDFDEGAHTIGKNLESIGICLAGNFDLTLPTPKQIDSLRKLLAEKMSAWKIPLENVVPHRRFAVKTCFGKNLSDTWAQDLVKNVGVGLTREQKIAKATALITEAMELLKGI